MQLLDFDYQLPKELIAQYPLKDRDAARLLVLHRSNNKIEHRIFRDIKDYLHKGDLLVLNKTKVLPCRLRGKRLSSGKVEVLLLRQKTHLTFEALVRPGRLKLREKIIFDGGSISAELTARNEVTFSEQDAGQVYKIGEMPLPPYIRRSPQELDSTYYQTVYAQELGSVAAPTAGLHFTSELLKGIKSCGVDIAYLNLDIGYATFKPVKAQDIREHKMEKECFRIEPEAIRSIEAVYSQGRRIVAVGTTSCRALETFALGKSEGDTDLFIYPGHKFEMTGALLTNFHLPRTTLFMLVCAFAGMELARKAYAEAVRQRYRFYSYGDAMLVV